jgi:uncharacterized protein YunC (DUF1805 family)
MTMKHTNAHSIDVMNHYVICGLTDIEGRNSSEVRACHIINIDTIDSHAEASNGATASHQLVDMVH